MYTLNVRIALHSVIKDDRLQKLYGSFYIVDVDNLKDVLKNMKGVEYSLIIHDRDTTCNKSHLHLVIASITPIDVDFWKSLFPMGYMSECRSLDASLLYLLHRGHADKVQYDVDELFTNIDYCDRFPFLNKGVF